MTHLKMLGLAALMAAALIAFVGAGTASATGGVLCSTATNPCTSSWAVPQTFDFSLKAGTSSEINETAPPNGEGGSLNTCTTATLKGNLTSNPAGGPATGTNTEITWGGCTFTTKTTKLGKLRVTSDGDTGNGLLVVDEEIKWTTVFFGFDCEYGFKAGTIIGTIDEGKSATLTVNAVLELLGGFGCPETTLWTATYVQTEPSSTTLYVGTASASGGRLCSTASNPCNSPWATPQTLDFSLKSGGSAELKETAPPNGEGEVLDTCTSSTVQGNITSNPAGGPATGSNTSITWGGCTFTTKTTKLGKLRVTSDGDGNGTLFADEEIKVTILAFGFITCEYGVTSGTPIGTIDEGKPATFTANAVARLLGGFGCPETSLWTATYVQTTPSNTTLYVSTS